MATSPAPSVISAADAADVGDYLITCTGGTAGTKVSGSLSAYLNVQVASSSQPKLLIDNGASGTFTGTRSDTGVTFSSVTFPAPGTNGFRSLRISGIRASGFDPYISDFKILLYVTFLGNDAAISNPMQTVAVVSPQGAPAGLSVSPAYAAVTAGAARQFTAGGSGSAGLVWSVDGLRGGTAANGTISASGLYSAPAAAPNPAIVTVTAATATDPPRSASAAVVVLTGSSPEAALSVSPARLLFEYRAGSSPAPASQRLSIASTGGALTYAVSAPASWLSAAPAGGTTPGTVTVSVDPAGLAAGVYQGKVSVTSAGAANSPLAVDVTLTITATGAVLVDKLLTKSRPPNGCDRPVPATEFSPADASANLWFTVREAVNGDKVTSEWRSPDGTVHASSRWDALTNVSPGYTLCFTDWIDIAGTSAASKPGTWTVRVNWNGTPFLELPFTISTAAAQMTLSSSSLTFPREAAGTVSAGQAITLTNSGATRLTITGKSIRGTNSKDFTFSDNCAASLSPGEECTLSVRFAPAGEGLRKASLRIEGNVAGGSRSVSLEGTGVDLEPVAELNDAFLSTEPYAPPEVVSYVDSGGRTHSALAFPGRVFLAVAPETLGADAITQMVEANGGKVAGQIPGPGLYRVRVTPGTEGTLIGALQDRPGVILVTPEAPLRGCDSAPVSVPAPLFDDRSRYPFLPPNHEALIAQFDVYGDREKDKVCGLSHGSAVNRILTQNGQGAREYDAKFQLQPEDQGRFRDLVTGEHVSYGLARAAAGARKMNQRLIVNVSLGGLGPEEPADRTACERQPAGAVCSGSEGNYLGWKTNAFAFWVGVASQLEHMPEDLLDNTLVVVAAGNEGLDMTRETGLLKSFFPRAFAHMLIVGGTEQAGGQERVSPTLNSEKTTCRDSRGAPRNCGAGDSVMLYAPGYDVPIPGTNPPCKSQGTSLAAPQVANMAARLARSRPSAGTGKLVQAMLSARNIQGRPALALRLEDVEKLIPEEPPFTFVVPRSLSPAARVGAPYRYAFCTPPPPPDEASGCGRGSTNPTGGIPEYVFWFDPNASPSPPSWLSLSAAGTLTGTPPAKGEVSFSLCASDHADHSECGTTSLEALGPVLLKTLTLESGTAVGGKKVPGTVALTERADTDVEVTLKSGDPAVATVPASVKVEKGRSEAPFDVETKPVQKTAQVKISASVGVKDNDLTAPLAVTPPEEETFRADFDTSFPDRLVGPNGCKWKIRVTGTLRLKLVEGSGTVSGIWTSTAVSGSNCDDAARRFTSAGKILVTASKLTCDMSNPQDLRPLRMNFTGTRIGNIIEGRADFQKEFETLYEGGHYSYQMLKGSIEGMRLTKE